MTLEQFIAQIPNYENVDTAYATVVFKRLINLNKLMERMPDEPIMLGMLTSNGSDRYVTNPYWAILKSETTAVQSGLSELNITPRSRKSLINNLTAQGALPTLGKK